MKHAPLLLLGWAAALLLSFHPMLFSGLERIPGDLGDARLINYLLEHNGRWLLREPLHRDLWSPPVFYPATNTAAYSDLLLSAAPFYLCWRVCGFPPDDAFCLWLLTVASFNYLAMYAFLARGLRLRSLAAALGALLFTAGNARVAEILHPQLYVHFYTVAAVYALVRFFETNGGAPSPLSPGAWYGVLCVAGLLQIYASFYLGWFLAFGLLLAAVIACCGARTRPLLSGILRQRWRAIGVWSAVAAILTAPLAWHYLLAAREVGMRDWGSVAVGLPAPQAWLLVAPGNWLYSWLPSGWRANSRRRFPHEPLGRLGALARAEETCPLFPHGCCRRHDATGCASWPFYTLVNRLSDRSRRRRGASGIPHRSDGFVRGGGRRGAFQS